MQAVWASAMTAAQEQARSELAAQHGELEIERAALLADRAELAKQAEATQQQLASLQVQLDDTKMRLKDATAASKQLQVAVSAKDAELAVVRQSLAETVIRGGEERRRHDAQLQEMASQNREQLDQARSTERRLALDIDRLRQTLKKSEQSMSTMQNKHEEELKALGQAHQALGSKLHEAELEISSLTERVKSSQARCDQLQQFLEERVPAPTRRKRTSTAPAK